jgi:hypothetical protein
MPWVLHRDSLRFAGLKACTTIAVVRIFRSAYWGTSVSVFCAFA